MINYYTVRIITIILIFSLIFLMNKYLVKNKNKKNQVIIWIIVVVSYIAINIFPFEKFINFNDIEMIFKYYHPNGKIIKVSEGSDYAYIYFLEKGQTNFIYYIKKDKWIMDNDFYRGQGKLKKYDYCTIFTNKIIDKDITAIVIDCLNDGNVISDSLSTNFDRFKYNEYQYIYMGIIDTKVSSNYTLNVNENEYKPFK